MRPKEHLYTLLDDFIHSRIYIGQFCSMFADTYHHEMDSINDLTVTEQNVFGALAFMAHGYTDNEDEIKMLPQYYFSGKQIVNKVNEIVDLLQLK